MELKVIKPTDNRKGLVEYRYRFRVEDEIISKYTRRDVQYFKFAFVIRTSFVLLHKDMKRVTLDIEGLGVNVPYQSGKYEHFWRFQDYWMSDNEIQQLADHLMLLAEQRLANLYPIVVDIDVCTVQQDGEPIGATMERAIIPRYMYPLRLYPFAITRKDGDHLVDELHKCFLSRVLCRIRVEGDGVTVMEECPICLRNSSIGVQITTLQCAHVFHNYCVVQWLQDHNSCPMCRRPVYTQDFKQIPPI